MFITQNKHSLKYTLWLIETSTVWLHKTKHVSSSDSDNKNNTTDTDSNNNSDNVHSNNDDEDVLDEVLPVDIAC